MTSEILSNENVTTLNINDKEIYIVGTAHISNSSAELAEAVIREIKPDSVAVELCDSRYQSLQDPDRWKNTNIVSIIREGKAYVLLAQLILAGFQKKLGDHLKVKPGEEMMRSIKVAKEVESEIVLADRDVKTTLKRTWANLGLWSMLKVVGAMIAGLFTSETMEEDEIERLKSSDALDELMKDFSDTLPEVKESLITERDKYLAYKIRNAPGKTVVAIVGAGHVPGMKEWITRDVDIKKLEELPKKKLSRKIIPWAIPCLVLALITYGFISAGSDTSNQMIISWVVINSFLGGLGALIALAHPLSILTAVVVSPITSLNPFIAAGWVAGLTEATIRKPRIADLEDIGNDVTSIKGFYKNRVSRILLVMCLTNLFGTIGTFLGLERIISFAA